MSRWIRRKEDDGEGYLGSWGIPARILPMMAATDQGEAVVFHWVGGCNRVVR